MTALASFYGKRNGTNEILPSDGDDSPITIRFDLEKPRNPQ